MYRKTFELVQHTPIIHFQHDQTGATLRATEVKPKLDRWLIKNTFKNQRPAFEHFLIGGKKAIKNALDYKLHIISEGQTIASTKDAKGYFADLGSDSPKKLIIFENVYMSILTVHLDLAQVINQQMGQFLLHNNFGTRSNRGFGSFTLLNEENKPDKTRCQFTVGKNDWASKKNLPLKLKCFDHIDWLYKSLRQGINHGKYDSKDKKFVQYLYMKPMIFQYAASLNIQWEKKTIKERFFATDLNRQQSKYTKDQASPTQFSSNQKLIVRDLLGLSSEQSWKNYGRGNPKITKEAIQSKADIDKHGVLKRYPSPLRFKPVKYQDQDFYTIYLWWEDLDNYYKKSKYKLRIDGRDNEHPNISMWESFDLNKFMDFALNKKRVRNSLKNINGQGNRLEELIIHIYSELIESYK
ncbi:MAG: hypothetical protein AAGF87_10470 [Bacteroidota bacterium]